ncbi:hypothetical protein [Nostoc sp. MG11]|uniref:hypothetical protein n=1 Tax=Nostoc sp. MG11 TaxID=2721166 RepID=UPI001866B001|nr:hypothetical protein [Nostoc sp. MG11]
MLKRNRASLVLAAALIIVPTILSMPANAQTKVYVVGERDQNWDRDGRRNYRNRTPINRHNWNRNNEPRARIVRLRNGDIRYSNGQIVPARRIVRLRNQGYFRLPNGDILLPTQEIVPARRLVRVRDGHFRLPNGVVVQINL